MIWMEKASCEAKLNIAIWGRILKRVASQQRKAIMTAVPEAFYGRNYVDVIQALQDNIINPNSTKLVEVDARSKRKGK